ncbi:SGNH/GDSL hydrolase family protein [Pontiellaceae bacterium B12219]|nr:SGNH/GDSL hydrolase family protein [Pontiellaceae bacterium B12219]
MKNRINVLLIVCLMATMNPAANAGNKNDFAYEPSTAEQVEAAHLSDRANGYDISSFSPERQAWEKQLDLYLEDFYYTRYLTAKKEGKETSWDYVEDVPGLPRMLIIGDSISRGYTLPLRHELAGKVNVHRAPQNCSSTIVGMDKLDIWLGDGNWDLITFNFGIHDRRDPSADYEMRLRQIVERLKKTDAKLIWVTTTPIPEDEPEYVEGAIERLNQVAEKIMTEQNIPVLDLYQAVSPNLAQYQRPKNCHFRESGYDFMGTLMAEVIMEQLEGVKNEDKINSQK